MVFFPVLRSSRPWFGKKACSSDLLRPTRNGILFYNRRNEKTPGNYPDESLEENNMNITITEEASFCPACDTRLNLPGLQRCNSCGIECYLEINQTNHADQRTRLLRSWGVVLNESWTVESGAGRW
jgi:hypothetical protein